MLEVPNFRQKNASNNNRPQSSIIINNHRQSSVVIKTHQSSTRNTSRKLHKMFIIFTQCPNVWPRHRWPRHMTHRQPLRLGPLSPHMTAQALEGPLVCEQWECNRKVQKMGRLLING
jgi:hypothetical protein